MSKKDIRVVLSAPSGEKDITDKRIIIWGAGIACKKACEKIQLDNIAYIIDSSKDKNGKGVTILGHEYCVMEPNILNELSPNEFFVCVASKLYYEEIKHDIINYYSDWINSYGSLFKCYLVYPSLQELLYFDEYVKDQIKNNKLQTQQNELLKKAEEIIRDNINSNKKLFFAPMYFSSRVICKIYDDSPEVDSKYIMHFPDKRISAERVKEMYTVRNELSICKKVIIYEDWEGFQLAYRGDPLDNLEDRMLVRDVMVAIKSIHDINLEANRSVFSKLFRLDLDFETRHWEGVLANNNSQIVELGENIRRIFGNEINNGDRSFIHGDFSWGNIIKFDNKIEIIDWDSMAIGDPIIDVCVFFKWLIKDFPESRYSFKELLELYYNRPPTKREIDHGRAVFVYVLYWKYLDLLRMNIEHSFNYRLEIELQISYEKKGLIDDRMFYITY